MRRFGGERVQSMMGRFGVEEDIPIQHSWIDKTIESAQTRVEGYNFDIRKHVLEYDDVVNKQREVIYAQRREVLSATDLRDQVLRMVRDEVGGLVAVHTPGPNTDDWDLRGLRDELRSFVPLPTGLSYRKWKALSSEEIEDQVFEIADQVYDELNEVNGRELYRRMAREDVTLEALSQSGDPLQRMIYERVVARLGERPDEDVVAQPIRRLSDDVKSQVETAFLDAFHLFRDRQLMLRAVDRLWVRHLTDLDVLREGIRLRAYGQQNPLVAYRKEAFEMYEGLLARVQEEVARSALLPILVIQQPQPRLQARRPGVLRQAARRAVQQQPLPPAEAGPKRSLGRNDPCWCGSGKKYKHCHLQQDQAQQSSVAAPKPSGTSRKKRRRRK
jgi:preprotein translocase subunit SecA